MANETPAVRRLPSFSELHHDIEQAFKNDEFKTLLNQTAPESWFKNHPMATMKNAAGKTVPAKYLPIDKVEWLLDRIFQEWRCEVLREGQMFQSIYVTVRIHYLNPITGVWSYHDGVGAKSVQVNKGESAADLSAIKDAAVQMALPSAKSYAIKDACDHLGKLFGRDVNRVDTIDFKGAYTRVDEPAPDKSEDRLIKMIDNCKTRVELNKLKPNVSSPAESAAFDKKFSQLTN